MATYMTTIGSLLFLCESKISLGDWVVDKEHPEKGVAKVTYHSPIKTFAVYNPNTPQMELLITNTENLVNIINQL